MLPRNENRNEGTFAKYICVAQCVREDHGPVWEGDYTFVKGHCYRLMMKTWKRAGMRPAMCCVLCGDVIWATSDPRRPCRL